MKVGMWTIIIPWQLLTLLKPADRSHSEHVFVTPESRQSANERIIDTFLISMCCYSGFFLLICWQKILTFVTPSQFHWCIIHGLNFLIIIVTIISIWQRGRVWTPQQQQTTKSNMKGTFIILLFRLQTSLTKCYLSPGHQLWQIQIVSQCQWPSSRYRLLISCKLTPIRHSTLALLGWTFFSSSSSKLGKMLLSDSRSSSDPKFTAADDEMQDNPS